jgi:hypothetical protein
MVTFDQPYHHTWNRRVFLRAVHVTHTRRAHQSIVATQRTLQHRAYDHNCKAKIGLILKFGGIREDMKVLNFSAGELRWNWSCC